MATQLTKPQKFVFYFLVSTNSQVRFALEGRSGDTYGSNPTNAPATSAVLNGRITNQLKLVFGDSSLDYTSIKNAAVLFDKTAGALQFNNVTLDQVKIRTAIGMDDFYDPGGDPCPSDYSNASGSVVKTNEQSNIVAAILGPVHFSVAVIPESPK